MPGIYVNDGGATSSALGNILGGIAQQVGPEAAAKAQLLYQQTQGADIANERTYTQEVLDANAARQAGGILATGGADAQPPGGVPGAVAKLAQPPITGPGPGGRYPLVDTTGMAPNQTYMAGRLFSGMSPGDLTTAINLGRNEALGPGQDFATGNAIVQSQSTPQHVASGDTLVIDPRKGNTPGNVIVGGDPAATAAEHDQRVADVADANKRAGLAQTAAQQLNENDRLLNVYNTLVNNPGTDDTLGVIGDQAFKDLATIPGLGDATKLSSRLGAIAAIQARLGSSINNQLQAVQPGDPVRGLLSTIKPPDPASLDPDSFRAAMAQYQRVLQYQKDEGPIAETFRSSSKLKPDADAYRAGIATHADSVFKKEQQENQPPAPAPAAPAAPAPAPAPAPRALHPATDTELSDARATVAKVPPGFTPPQWRQRVIDHFKQQGADLTARGF